MLRTSLIFFVLAVVVFGPIALAAADVTNTAITVALLTVQVAVAVWLGTRLRNA